ncbi:hypothetical protein M670_00160 [Schinkia azotoformans MEV2011]|uniref:dUTPase n=1 Tax=Schinkia azotoformans MEV2011 TaxID=1348973 RepID=A0A072NR61_SCHAZ|nr:dUTP diphosphatase [Schinkia azotoformans]KEF40144.1 hypothetical protein M670_00160 [Schinkia azotoformans MEV2011]
MNLKKLFEMQRILDEHIMNEHPELRGKNNLDWKILALQVELGECANEWRGFKKWSKNQEPRNKDIECHACKGKGKFVVDVDHFKAIYEECGYCDGAGIQEKNPLLMEYVDCLHFILSIGLEIKDTEFDENDMNEYINSGDESDLIKQFSFLFWVAAELGENIFHYKQMLYEFIDLGKNLGFSWGKIEQAYLDKNKVNHQRQETGY